MRNRIVVLAVTFLALSSTAFAAGGVRIRIGVGGFRGYYAPTPYYRYAPAWGFWGPAYHFGYAGPIPAYRSDDLGKIRLEGANRQDRIYLDGGYAGVAGDLKTITVRPGAYSLEVKRGGQGIFTQRVYVVRGKTLRINIVPETRVD